MLATGSALVLLLASSLAGALLLGVGCAGASADPDPQAARDARARMVDEVARLDPQLSPRVLDVLREVPRHRFMPGASLSDAYWNGAHPIGHGQTISQPTVVAIMTDALALDGAERVLEIGTGSGYQAAILAKLAREVYSIELVPALATSATERLRALGYANVHVKQGDGYLGWPEHAPFDRILLTAAPPELPDALVAQLRDGGIIVAPVGEREQMLYRWTKRGDELKRETLGAVRFVPMVESSPRG
jgi:protein-L-isoaspartate(D-aspartate) O-methyltransferase